MGSNCLVRNDLTHVIAGIAGARNHGWNPAGTPRDTVFLAAFGAMTPCLDPIGAGAASAASDSSCRSSLAALTGRLRPASDARPRAYGP
jgi:hypothetical protein